MSFQLRRASLYKSCFPSVCAVCLCIKFVQFCEFLFRVCCYYATVCVVRISAYTAALDKTYCYIMDYTSFPYLFPYLFYIPFLHSCISVQGITHVVLLIILVVMSLSPESSHVCCIIILSLSSILFCDIFARVN